MTGASCDARACACRSSIVPAADRPRAERDAGREREQDAARHGPPAPDLPPAPCCSAALARRSVLVGIGHRKDAQHRRVAGRTGKARGGFQTASRATALESALVVLSDRTIGGCSTEGRIGIDPYDEALLQPSSVDVRVDRFFRVFHNARYPFIDVKQPQEELTELVEIDDERPFILHPGEFVLGSTLERDRAAGRPRRAARGQELARAGSAC